MTRSFWPILVVLSLIIGLWYLAVAPMNLRGALDQAERAGVAIIPEGSIPRQSVNIWRLMADNPGHIAAGYSLKRPRPPAPHQVTTALWQLTGALALKGRGFSKRSLLFHSWVTLTAALRGFALGCAFAIIGAIAIVYGRVFDLSLMPWAIVSQTVPIVALAPMIIALSNQLGIEGRALPKAIISAYMCYFPVLIGLIKGLRAPHAAQFDLFKTFNASPMQSFLRLRLPTALPYLFPALKVGIAAAIVGTIVGELPTGAVQGLGARILIADQFGQPLHVWAALFSAAILAGLMVMLLEGAQRLTFWSMGGVR